MKLKEALTKIQFDKALAEEFLKDPKGVLQKQGVDTSDIFIDPVKEAKTNIEALGICAKVCANVGIPFVGCHEIGQNIGA